MSKVIQQGVGSQNKSGDWNSRLFFHVMLGELDVMSPQKLHHRTWEQEVISPEVRSLGVEVTTPDMRSVQK